MCDPWEILPQLEAVRINAIVRVDDVPPNVLEVGDLLLDHFTGRIIPVVDPLLLFPPGLHHSKAVDRHVDEDRPELLRGHRSQVVVEVLSKGLLEVLEVLDLDLDLDDVLDTEYSTL